MLPTPANCTPLQILKPSAHGRLNTNTSAMLISTAFLRDQPCISIANAMMFSNTAMTVEIAAKLINTKNSVPQMRPKCIALKILGSVMKISPGP